MLELVSSTQGSDVSNIVNSMRLRSSRSINDIRQWLSTYVGAGNTRIDSLLSGPRKAPVLMLAKYKNLKKNLLRTCTK